MRRSALRRAALVSLVLVASSIVLALAGPGRVGVTYALFDAETQNAGSVFAGGWIGAPTGVQTPVASGADVTLSWTPGTHGPITGQQLLAADNGNSSSCPAGPSYGAVGSLLATTATGTTDSGRGSSANGHWYCYAVESVTASSWTAQTAAPAAVRVGFVATSVVISDTGAAGAVSNGDTIAVTYNQAPQNGSGSVCTFPTSRTILLGASSCSSDTNSATVGKLVASGTMTTANTYSATYGVSGNVLTVTISGNASTNTTLSGTPTWTFTPGTLQSSVGSAAVCTSSGSNCLPTPSGAF